MTVDSLSRSTAGTPRLSANRTPQAHVSRKHTPATMIFPAQAPSLTFHLILVSPHSISSNLMTALPNHSQPPKWPHSSQSHTIPRPILPISFFPSFVSTPKSRPNTRVGIIKATSQRLRTALIASATSHTSTRNYPTGQFPCPVSQLIGRTCAWKGPCSRVTPWEASSKTNLGVSCLCSLLSALAPSHPDRNVWLASFREEKDGIKSQDTYDTLTLEQYRAYHAQGAPRAIPTMCVLTIKTQ